MPIMNILAEVTVSNFSVALVWYERLLGRPADQLPMDNLAVWQITETGGIQVWRDVDRAGKALMTISVDDLKAHMAGLAQRDITSQSDTDTKNVLTATVVDPDGNRITFAEVLSTT